MLHQPQPLQLQQRLAHRSLRNPQLSRQALLTEPLPWLALARQNPSLNLVPCDPCLYRMNARLCHGILVPLLPRYRHRATLQQTDDGPNASF